MPYAGLKALLWDVDGTLAETERDGHRLAFNQAFAACGLAWRWDVARYGELLQVTGGRERLLRDMASHADAPAGQPEREALAQRLHALKNALYHELVKDGQIALRAGVKELMGECRDAGVAMAIVTTTSRSNVAALLQAQLGAGWPTRFKAVVCGEDVARKKPDPEAYLRALALLGHEAHAVLAIEDSPAGLAAARAAGVAVIITRSSYYAAAGFEGALAVGPGLQQSTGWQPAVRGPASETARIRLAALSHWHERMRAGPLPA
jgi:HAD superfamily hydrolase (TIGR01509 family)